MNITYLQHNSSLCLRHIFSKGLYMHHSELHAIGKTIIYKNNQNHLLHPIKLCIVHIFKQN